ncbi:MAG TPA: hypothetical protein VHD85_15495 [Terracidiphilus sp.]|nr:hypothetical protein [Terracidiphilus sp.]
MNPHDQEQRNDEERWKALLQQALPPVSADSEPSRDLWPAMLARLHAVPLMSHWFDWALLAALIALVAIFPASISVLLYYL